MWEKGILALQPVDVLRVLTRGRQIRQLSSIAQRFVDVEHLAEHDRERSTVENRMVEGPEDFGSSVAQSDDRETHERRAREIEAKRAVRRRQRG